MKEQLEQVLGPVHAQAWVHAVDLTTGKEAGYGEDTAVVLASVFKIPVLVELFRRFGDGRLDPATRMDVPVDGRSAGPTGLSVMAGPIELSLRDLAYWMMSVSDNAATDILVNLLGTESINATVRELGLTATRVDGTCDDIYQTIYADIPDTDELELEAWRAARAIDPARTLQASTPRDITRLLAAIWNDEAAPPEQCAEMRRILAGQAWPHRLRSAFTETGTIVSAKTGTLRFWRNEAGVVRTPDGSRYAVASFVRTDDPDYRLPAVDAAVGSVARILVDNLRSVPTKLRTPVTATASTPDEIRAYAGELGAEIWLHARDLATGRTVGVDAETPVVTASVLKVPVALELARQAVAGEVDLTERITVPTEGLVPSPYGLAMHRDPALVSYDDLALLMMVISDNVATDLVIDRVGKDRVAALLAELGLPGTAVPQNCAEILASIEADLAISYTDDERELADVPVEQLRALRALDPAGTCRTTPDEITSLLAGIWRDEAADPEACALVRGWMGKQVWPHRLSSGFPGDEVTVSGKTGTLPLVRNEVGVVEFPDGGRYAVGVFTRAADPAPNAPQFDGLIGWAAAQAVAQLRS
ncbi:serine hydrolase [Kribbella sp. NBC_00889]|uniref:serine hydrolase n=1 Tax=Kribbella sp. NBC_00889 TaxID=2975974 RepID=UPI0038642B06|nr:class A beta-lactamase-related serine hydrolase [Kribbella sp. NBC_00889]